MARWLLILVFGLPTLVSAEEPKKPDADPKKKADQKKDDQKKDDKKKDGKKRELAPDSPVGRALDDLLEAPARYGKDGKVELVYEFKPERRGDWIIKSFDRIRFNEGRIILDVRRQGLFLHKLHMQGNFEVELKCRIRASMPSSTLVIVFGGGKSGAIFGNALAKGGRRGYRVISRKLLPDKSPWAGGREVTLKYKIEDGVRITCWVNGKKRGVTNRLKNRLDGQVGIYTTNNLRLVVQRMVIRGEIDTTKLKP